MLISIDLYMNFFFCLQMKKYLYDSAESIFIPLIYLIFTHATFFSYTFTLFERNLLSNFFN